MKIEGAVALVTGGANGIGKMVVETLLEKGAKLVSILDCDEAAGIAIEAELQKKYSKDRVKFFNCDVTRKEELENAFTSTQSMYNRLDIVCNNAGIEQIPDLDKLMQTDLIAPIVGTEIAKKMMVNQADPSGGVIVNTASLAGLYPSHVAAYYSAAKSGIISYTRAQAGDPVLQKANIRLNCICPAFVKTNLDQRIRQRSDAPELRLATINANPVPMSAVRKAFLMAIEDDTLSGRDIRVTVGLGADLHPLESVSEAMEKFKVFKLK